MNLAEIQSFRKIGRRLRKAREMQCLTLPAISGACGLAIYELVRIKNGELLGFKQVSQDTLSNAEVYAKALDIELDSLDRHSEVTKINAQNDDVFIPIFLIKNNQYGFPAPAGLTTFRENLRWFFIAKTLNHYIFELAPKGFKDARIVFLQYLRNEPKLSWSVFDAFKLFLRWNAV